MITPICECGKRMVKWYSDIPTVMPRNWYWHCDCEGEEHHIHEMLHELKDLLLKDAPKFKVQAEKVLDNIIDLSMNDIVPKPNQEVVTFILPDE